MKENLIKLISVLETKQLANIFKNYMNTKNIKKFDGRKKENNNSYLIYGKDEGWDRVYCIYYNNENINDIDIIFRKRAGLYLIIKSGTKIVFEYYFNGTKFNTYYDELLFNQINERHKELFDELLKLI